MLILIIEHVLITLWAEMSKIIRPGTQKLKFGLNLELIQKLGLCKNFGPEPKSPEAQTDPTDRQPTEIQIGSLVVPPLRFGRRQLQRRGNWPQSIRPSKIHMTKGLPPPPRYSLHKKLSCHRKTDIQKYLTSHQILHPM